MSTAEAKTRETAETIRTALETGDWSSLNTRLREKRLNWFNENYESLDLSGTDVRKAYEMFVLTYLGVSPEEAPVVYEDEWLIVWRSFNWCPVHEACKRHGFDSRKVCKLGWENSVQAMVEKINPHLRFSRNYEKIRPYTGYCEEYFELT